MPALQDVRHEAFAIGIVSGKTNKDAYLGAGFNCKSDEVATACASRLKGTASVSARISELQEKVAETITLKRADIIRELHNILLIGTGQREVEVTHIDRKTGETKLVKYKGLDLTAANRAGELIGRELAMFVDRKEIGAPGDFSNMPREKLSAFIVETLQKAAELAKPNQNNGLQIEPPTPSADMPPHIEE